MSRGVGGKRGSETSGGVKKCSCEKIFLWFCVPCKGVRRVSVRKTWVLGALCHHRHGSSTRGIRVSTVLPQLEQVMGKVVQVWTHETLRPVRASALWTEENCSIPFAGITEISSVFSSLLFKGH